MRSSSLGNSTQDVLFMKHLLLSSKKIQLSLSLQYTTELLRKAGLKGFENKSVQYQDLPGSPVVKTLRFNARGFYPWLGH